MQNSFSSHNTFTYYYEIRFVVSVTGMPLCNNLPKMLYHFFCRSFFLPLSLMSHVPLDKLKMNIKRSNKRKCNFLLFCFLLNNSLKFSFEKNVMLRIQLSIQFCFDQPLV